MGATGSTKVWLPLSCSLTGFSRNLAISSEWRKMLCWAPCSFLSRQYSADRAAHLHRLQGGQQGLGSSISPFLCISPRDADVQAGAHLPDKPGLTEVSGYVFLVVGWWCFSWCTFSTRLVRLILYSFATCSHSQIQSCYRHISSTVSSVPDPNHANA